MCNLHLTCILHSLCAVLDGAFVINERREVNIGALGGELPQLNVAGTEDFRDFEIVLDSCACWHVVDAEMPPG